jgi:hypothetical protein
VSVTPEDLVEIERIRQLKARYFQLMDQKRWDEWQMGLTEDVTIDTTQEADMPVIEGRKAFLEFLPPVLERVQTVHHGHMSQIELTSPTTATGTWSMEDMLWWPPDRGGQKLWGMGWYFEKYRKEADGEWRIQELKLRRIRVEVNGEQVFPPPA